MSKSVPSPSTPRLPDVDDPISYFNNYDPPEPNPAPGVVDKAYPDGSIDCTITLADYGTRRELRVPAPDPTIDYFRYWEPGGPIEPEPLG
ncbi:MAG: hypothetical protein QOG72_2442 [Sphingomonadales bacterium]|jgi:hypothetical protein|nr:hypothetical protein [Sphingomonadales bacterium]